MDLRHHAQMVAPTATIEGRGARILTTAATQHVVQCHHLGNGSGVSTSITSRS